MKEIIGRGLEKQSKYLTEPGLILQFVGLGLEKLSDYLTGYGFILLYIRRGFEKHQDYLISCQHARIKYEQKLTLYGRCNNS